MYKTPKEFSFNNNNNHSEKSVFSETNMFEASMILIANDVRFNLLENIYESKDCIQFLTEQICLELRSRPDFYDVKVDVSPVHVHRTASDDGKFRNRHLKMDYMFIEETSLKLGNLVGPLPKGLVYASDWRFDFGRISAEIKPRFLSLATRAVESFIYTFGNLDNDVCPPITYPLISAIQITVPCVDIYLWNPTSVILLKLAGGLLFQTDNFANENWINRFFIQIPNIQIQALAEAKNGVDRGGVNDIWHEVFSFTSSINVSKYGKSMDFKHIIQDQK
jgi:hypothetical protein